MFYLPDSDLREALRRKYADTPELPSDFMEQMRQRMERSTTAPDRFGAQSGGETIGHARHRMRWVAAAASILFIIGIGYGVIPRDEERSTRHENTQLAKNETKKIQASPHPSDCKGGERRGFFAEQRTLYPQPSTLRSALPLCSAKNPQPSTFKPQPSTREQAHPKGQAQSSGKYVGAEPQYASYATAVDSAYRVPSQMDEFIAKMAMYNKVLPVSLDCTAGTGDTTIVGTAYVFPDNEQRFDVFSRLLQAACSYSCKTPGYLLNFSRQQFFFCLKDLQKGQKYLWVAERISGKRILLFSTHSSIDAKVSSTCLQDYRDELTHTNL